MEEHQKLLKLFVKAENCESRKKAQKLIRKADKIGKAGQGQLT